MAKEAIRCCICSKIIWSVESNNPWPVREYSSIGSTENRCCHSCNNNIVTPMRIVMMNLTEDQKVNMHEKLKTLSFYDLDNFVRENNLPTVDIPEQPSPFGEPTEDDLA